MYFTFDAYKNLISEIVKHGYAITDYHSYQTVKKPCILRYDVDMDLKRAAAFAEMEAGLEEGVKATYFVLVSSNFYNLFSRENQELIHRMVRSGHEIGLHFDEKKYMTEENFDAKLLKKAVVREVKFLEDIIENPVKVVSMHRPSKKFLESEMEFEGIINSYDSMFFQKFKYISDSRMNWREPVEKIVAGEKEEALHILTHPIWYRENEVDMHRVLEEFVRSACIERYENLDDNLRDLNSILKIEEIIC